MNDVVVKVENLTKEYRLGTSGYGTLREDLQSFWARIRGKEDPNSLVTFQHNQLTEKKHFLALNDISFEVNRGDRVGIIGRNGAGKSTLLKLLSRVTSPTKGSISILGRIGSLLEVGTGFHGELTGKENIYLNGSILGMKKSEITSKLDEIVSFAGVEKFMNTPVKRYSSGMIVRLGFAVAAHLDPEILIVDEVLAVGDLEFQKKALGKMEEVSQKDGRTIFFVSHNMNSIQTLCSKSILLENGSLTHFDETSAVINRYYESSGFLSIMKNNADKIIGDQFCKLVEAEIVNDNNTRCNIFSISQRIKIQMRYRILKKSEMVFVPNFHFKTIEGVHAFVDNVAGMKQQEPGNYLAECTVPASFLNDGVYMIGIAVTGYSPNNVHVCFWEDDALTFTVKDLLEDDSKRYGYTGIIPGIIRPSLDWEVTKES